MNFSINPQMFQSMQIGTDKEQMRFLYQLSQLLKEMAGAITSATTINQSELVIKAASLGSVSTSQAVDCTNACAVAVTFSFTASITLTLNNLGSGVPVAISALNAGGGTLTLKVAATQPSGSAFSLVQFVTGGAATNFATTGWAGSAGAQRIFTGITNGSVLQTGLV